MASEIRVDKINSLSGVGTVTLSPTGVDIAGITTVSTLKVGTGVTASEDGDIFFTGIATATTFVGNLTGDPTGSGANLTALPAGQLTGTVADARISTLTASKLSGALPAISALNLTNVPAANVVGVHTSLNITGSTTVGGGVTISESGIEASGIGITCANINGAQISGRRNKIYNGKMDVDQRNSGSSVSLTNNLTTYTVDRFAVQPVNMDEATDMTAQQVDDGPDGFAHSLKITTNTAESAIAANEFVDVYQKMEGQDFQDLAYNTSGAKDITMSFYVKSSITGTFGFAIYRDEPGTDRIVNKTYTINSANTWERKTITIAGDTGRAVNNTNTSDWWNIWHLAVGSNYDSSTSSTWQNYTTTNWGGGHAQDGVITTAGATWQITGVQLEVGSQATAFEHRSFHEERELCKRYYHAIIGKMGSWGSAVAYSTQNAQGWYSIHPEMRAAPTFTWTGTLKLEDGAAGYTTTNTTASTTTGTHGFSWWTGGFSGLTDNYVYYVYESGQTGYFQLDAEL